MNDKYMSDPSFRRVNEEEIELSDRYNELKSDLETAKDNYEKSIANQEDEEVIARAKKRYDDIRFELEYEMLVTGYKIDEKSAERSIARINIDNKSKLFKQKTGDQQQRRDNNHNAQDKVNDLMGNPLVTGGYANLLSDCQSVNVLRDFISVVSNEHNNKLSPQLQELIVIVNKVLKEYYKAISVVDSRINANLESLNDQTNHRKINRDNEYNAFKKDLKVVVSTNRIDNNDTYGMAEKENAQMKSVEILKERIKDLPSSINRNILEGNMDIVYLLDVIQQLENLLSMIESNLPQSNIYGNVLIDFSSVHEATKTAERLLKSKKDLNNNKLKENGFDKEMQKVAAHEKEQSVINFLAKEYEKLNSDIKGSLRKDIENNIENILIASGISEKEWERLKREAQMLAGYTLEGKRADERNKFHAIQKKQEREISIANRDLVTAEEFESIKREAIAAADRMFPENYAMKGGDAHDLNGDERQRFIDHYIDDKISQIAAYKYDSKEREQNADDKLRVDNTEEIAREGLTEDMLYVAADMLHGSMIISSDDISQLKPSEMRDVIEYAKKLKSFVGMDIDQVAAELAKEPEMDVNGKLRQKEVITPYDIVAQKAVIDKHNLMNRIDYAFNVDQGTELKR